MPKVKKSVAAVHHGGRAGRRRSSSRSFWLDKTDNFAGLIAIDDYTTFFRSSSSDDLRRRAGLGASTSRRSCSHPGEYYALLVISTIGAIYMAAAQRAADRVPLARAAELQPLHPRVVTRSSTRAPTRRA